MISRKYNEQMGAYLAKLAQSKPKQTNADRIRSMTDEELEKLLISVCNQKECPPHYVEPCRLDCKSGECWAKWLRQEAVPDT